MSEMNEASQARPLAVQVVANAEMRHRFLVLLTAAGAVLLIFAMGIYGWDYYVLSQALRPLSHKHVQLKPSGTVGLKLGMLGLFLFGLVYLYPLRKRWLWLARQGKAKHWLDFHIILGLVAPAVITFHSAFKIQGFAGMAWWTMIALVVSGLAGRYFYAQIPRTLDSANMSHQEMEDLKAQFTVELNEQNIVDSSSLAKLFDLPDIEQVRQMSLGSALLKMVMLDLVRPLKVWSIRRKSEGTWRRIISLGGMLPTRHYELERAIKLMSRQAALSKRILFISKAERVFFLWHVIHRPFSLSFAIFVIIHVGVVVSLGYF